MKKILAIAAVLGLAACGGTPGELFKGDPVVAELRDGVPFCSQGETGPTIKNSTGTTTSGNNGVPYQTQIRECDWTCGSINGTERAFVYVIFVTLPDGSWAPADPHADTIGAVAPAVCP